MKMPGRYGSENYPYRYGFNGMESDDEMYEQEGASNTTFFRQMDARIGRWLSYDPKPNQSVSPYAMMENNPIWYSDPYGDSVKMQGSKRQMKKFIKQLNKSSGEKYNFNKKGMIYKEKSNSKKENSKSFTKLMDRAISDLEIIELDLVENKEDVLIDSYLTGAVDLADLQKMDNDYRAGQIAHFISERLMNPIDYSTKNRTNENFEVAHKEALKVESKVISEVLGIPYSLVEQEDKLEKRTTSTGNVEYYYWSTSKYGNVTFGMSIEPKQKNTNDGRIQLSLGGTIQGKVTKKVEK